MLSLHLRPHDLDTPTQWRTAREGGRWVLGDSHLTPYLHPCLEAGMTLSEGRALPVIREHARNTTTWCSSSMATEHVGASEYQRRRG